VESWTASVPIFMPDPLGLVGLDYTPNSPPATRISGLRLRSRMQRAAGTDMG